MMIRSSCWHNLPLQPFSIWNILKIADSHKPIELISADDATWEMFIDCSRRRFWSMYSHHSLPSTRDDERQAASESGCIFWRNSNFAWANMFPPNVMSLWWWCLLQMMSSDFPLCCLLCWLCVCTPLRRHLVKAQILFPSPPPVWQHPTTSSLCEWSFFSLHFIFGRFVLPWNEDKSWSHLEESWTRNKLVD